MQQSSTVRSTGEPEPTYAQSCFGVPALVSRIDCTIVNGQIVPYEAEDSPSGIGITDRLHTSIGGVGIKNIVLEHYVHAVGDIPHVVVSGARAHGTDDELVVGSENYTFDTDSTLSVPDDKLVIVKAIPGNKSSAVPYGHLQDRAFAPFFTEGDKAYLERTGVAREVESPDDLLRSESGEITSQVAKEWRAQWLWRFRFF